jgi:hypothetical protein
MSRALDYATATDQFYDFCLYHYVPRTSFVGKLRSCNLLWHSFEVKNCPAGFYDLTQTIRSGIGHNRTIGGEKTSTRISIGSFTSVIMMEIPSFVRLTC